MLNNKLLWARDSYTFVAIKFRWIIFISYFLFFDTHRHRGTHSVAWAHSRSFLILLWTKRFIRLHKMHVFVILNFMQSFMGQCTRVSAEQTASKTKTLIIILSYSKKVILNNHNFTPELQTCARKSIAFHCKHTQYTLHILHIRHE